MTYDEKGQDIIDEFAVFDDWMDKYEYIIDLGKDLKPLDEAYKIEANLIKGCQSRVWLHTDLKDGKLEFKADSDAIITKGIIAVLIQVLNGEAPEVVAKADFGFVKEIGLHEHLSPTRANGLVSMIQKIKLSALTALNN
jgi:cysteine desulfuration protein SufE